ncbi:mucin-5AC-like [Homarus americanus]|uniref:mucin-5AC-like n=1 Tax=Homarus americanus TaxID=6706 RepID=UPI001C4446D3|nr:mucin-5AC-like [Homarus americanus]
MVFLVGSQLCASPSTPAESIGEVSSTTILSDLSNDLSSDLDLGPTDPAILALLTQLSQPGNFSQLEAINRRQRQIRFKSSYRELPEGLQGILAGGEGRNLEGLSYFIQVDLDDPPASKALAKLPEGTKTYFPPQLSEPGATLPQVEDSDDDTITQKAILVGVSSTRVPALDQEAAKTSSGSKTYTSPHLKDPALRTNSIHSLDDNELVTSPSTSTIQTLSPYEASTTENPNFIAKGLLVSSSYSAYSKPLHNSLTTRRHRVTTTPTPSTTPSYFVKSFSSLLRSSSPSLPSSPPNIQGASSPPSNFVSSNSFTKSSSSSSSSSHSTTSQSFSSYSSREVTTPSESTTPRSVPSYSFSTSSTRLPSRAPQSFSAISFTTPSTAVSSTSKPLKSSSPLTVSLNLNSLSRNSFTTSSPPVSTTSKSVSSYSFITSPPVVTSPSSFTTSSHSFNSESGKSSPSGSFVSSSPPAGSQVTHSSGPSSSPSFTLLPSHSPSPRTRTTVPSARRHYQAPSPPPRLPEKSSTLTKSFTNANTFTKHRSRPIQTPLPPNVLPQPKPRTNAKSLSSNPANTFQHITAPRRGGGGNGRGSPPTPLSDGKTRTLGNSDDPYTGSIPGRSGVDYPTFQTIPKTGFDCSSKPAGGYYADTEADCQVFHVCWSGRSASFLCPVGTLFSQQVLVCDWWYNVDCSSTSAFIDASPGVWNPTGDTNYL